MATASDPGSFADDLLEITSRLVSDKSNDWSEELQVLERLHASLVAPENDGTVHAAVQGALRERAESSDDAGAAELAAARWVEQNPDEFWDRFVGPMLDDLERVARDAPETDA
jgi:hypothetical protein